MKINELEKLCKEFTLLSKGIVNHDKHSMYVSTFHSTAIEGSTLTENQVIDLLYSGKTAAGKPFEHHQMVSDHYKALELIITKASHKEKLTIDFIKEIGALVMKNTGSEVNTILGTYDITKGDFRLSGVSAGRRQFPDAKKIEYLLKQMITEFNENVGLAKTFEQKCTLAFKLHFDFVSIHPFGDGNGRTSRLLMNYVQACFSLPLSIVFRTNRIQYIEAIENARKTENLDSFYRFMFAQYSRLMKAELKLMKV
jgi:Fic family protein